MNVNATDGLSGSGNRVTYRCTVTEVGTGNIRNLGENRSGNFTAIGLKPNTNYSIEVTAKDQAGNESKKMGSATTTDGSGSGGTGRKWWQ